MALKRCFVFDRKLCAVDESAGQDEMSQPLLFTWPDEELSDRLRHFSFAQGMIDFARAFADAGDPLELFNSASDTSVVRQCCDDVWIVLSVELNAGRCSEAQHPPIKALCKLIATQVALFCGSIRDAIDGAVMEDDGARVVDRLRAARTKLRKVEQLEEALAAGDREHEEGHTEKLSSRPLLEQELISLEARSPLPRLKLQLRFIILELIREFNDESCFDHLHLFHSLGEFGGFHFCPCDRLTYLSVQYFVNTLTFRFPQIERCALLFDGRIVWASIPTAQLKSVYAYLRTRAMRTAVDDASRFSQPFVHDIDGELFARYVYCGADADADVPAAAALEGGTARSAVGGSSDGVTIVRSAHGHP